MAHGPIGVISPSEAVNADGEPLASLLPYGLTAGRPRRGRSLRTVLTYLGRLALGVVTVVLCFTVTLGVGLMFAWWSVTSLAKGGVGPRS